MWMKPLRIFFLLCCFAFPVSALFAQDEGRVLLDKTTTVKAEVFAVLKDEAKVVPGTDVVSHYQTLTVKVLEGKDIGLVVTVSDDYAHLAVGDVFYLNETIRGEDNLQIYSVGEPYRLPALGFFAGLFVLLVFLVGGMQGIRGLISLAGSFVLILYALLPAIFAGFSPVLVSIIVSSVIIILGSYVTHGFNKTTSSAVLGMITTVILTGGLAFAAVHFAKLTGFESENAVYLNLNSRGHIDIIGILLSGFMIGLLGVLYDVAIGQAISVEELHRIAPHVERKKIYLRALRIGREHIGALVNTLAIAYVGASLPLLLLFRQSPSALPLIINKEIFATEIIRTLIGSSGLVLAVPITTLLAVFLLVKVRKALDVSVVVAEREALEHFHHH